MAVRLQGDALAPFQQYLLDFCEAYESLDVNRIGEYFSRNEVYCIGTGVDEVLTNRGSLLYALQRDYSELAEIAVMPEGELTALQVDSAVCLCWNLSIEYSLISTPDKVALMPPLRMTMMLEQQEQVWKAVQVHISAPIPLHDNERSFPEA